VKRKAQSREMRHVRLHHWMMATAAWKDLSATARAVYIEIAQRYNGTNNGFIVYSIREASRDLKIGTSTAKRAFDDLQSHGFIFPEQRGHFHWKIDVTGERHRPATEWRLTEFHSDRAIGIESKYPTKEFTRWTKIQNTVPPQVRDVSNTAPHVAATDTMKSKNGQNGTRRGNIRGISG
jgi:DNA-binding transcriptional MocR family regulator